MQYRFVHLRILAMCLVGILSIMGHRSILAQSHVGTFVDSTRLQLRCKHVKPLITADREHYRYDPMPFQVTMSLTNTGAVNTDTVHARIIVPALLQLHDPDTPDSSAKMLLPAVLKPGEEGFVVWTLWHPIVATTREYLIGMWSWGDNVDSAYHEIRVLIPPLLEPRSLLAPTCITPDSLHFDTATWTYASNPFTVTLRCVNREGLPAYDASGFVYLPADVVLSDAGDTPRHAFPSPLNEWKSGDSVPAVQWNVTYTKKHPNDTFLDFKFVAGAKGYPGFPEDSVETWCRVRVPGVPPPVGCEEHFSDRVIRNGEASPISMLVFPDPTEGLLNVVADGLSANAARVTLTDLLGRMVLECTVIPVSGRVVTSIDLAPLPSGMYLIRIGNDHSTAARVVRRW
ncbi:MAG: T9SS type A sorting domain-containing protein [Ignavibacteria bacterium]|nr:T9SS type A sorting domain-containing protein [Ignavibacteria bacterium]